MNFRKTGLTLAFASAAAVFSAPASAGWFDWLFPSPPVEEEEEVVEQQFEQNGNVV